MVKLYYTPTSCGASSFISAFIAKISLECETVDLGTHTTASGVDFYTINPKGNVPAIVLDDGTVINENIACLEYIADLAEDDVIAPKNGSTERYVVKQVLSYIASELHATIGLFFNPRSKEETIREFLLPIFERKMKYLQERILSSDRTFAVGNSFTIADSYLHIMLSWLGYVGLNLSDYPVAEQYYKSICELPYVLEAKSRISEKPSTTF